MKVESEGQARLALHAFIKHAAKNFKKSIEFDDDKVLAAVLTDFLAKVQPYYEISMLLGGYQIPEKKGEGNERTVEF